MLNFVDELESGFVGGSQRVIVNFSLWWFLPIILMLSLLGRKKTGAQTVYLFDDRPTYWYIDRHCILETLRIYPKQCGIQEQGTSGR